MTTRCYALFSAQKAYTGQPTSARKPTRVSRKGVRPQNRTKRGKTKQGTRSKEAPLPPRVRETGLREVPRKSKKRPGPRTAPRQNARKKGRTAKTGDKPGCGGDTKRKRQQTQSACGGVPCDYLIYLSEKKEKQGNKKSDDIGEKTKRGEKKTQKHQT